MNIRIGTRGSDLALWQSNFIKELLESFNHDIEITIIKTQGDKIQNLSFDKMEGKGFFTKEIEEALLNESIDLAIHSHKDLETTQPEGLTIAAVSYRENPADLMLISKEAYDENAPYSLKPNSKIGTSSARRQSLVRKFIPSALIEDLRGNVPTRIEKLRAGNYDAIILAAAGVQRLNLDLSDFMVIELPLDQFVPAPAQGVLAMQVLDNYELLKEALFVIDNPVVAKEIEVEREILRQLEGGCQLPFGAYCTSDAKNDNWYLTISYADSKNDPAEIYHFYAAEPEELVKTALKTLRP